MARETSCFGGPKPSFRDRCKGSERLYFEKQIFVAGAVLWDMVVIFALGFRDRCGES